jgi:UDP-2,3-diacylglucosamine pyrophosphatase LpxH
VTTEQALVQFLRQIQTESETKQQEIELILNGDFFDFLQVPAVDKYDSQQVYPIDAYTDSSEAASLKRLRIISEQQPGVFKALSEFMHPENPQRRVTIIKGDHDVSLFWPGVKGYLRKLLEASGTRSSLLLFAGEFIKREKIYVEHGHQQAEKVNRYPDFIDPRHPDNPTLLYYPPSSALIINLINDIKPNTWVITSIKPATNLIWYALSWNFGLAVKMLTHFFSDMPQRTVVDEFLQALENEETRRELAQQYANNSKFRQAFHYRVLHYLNLTTPPSETEATKNVLNLLPSEPLIISQTEQEHQQNLLRQAADDISKKHKMKVILFGHTHHPSQQLLRPGHVYINTGSWTRDFTNVSAETLEALFTGKLEYHDVANKLPYARIDYDDTGEPIIAQLLYFATQSDAPVENDDVRHGRWFGNFFSF